MIDTGQPLSRSLLWTIQRRYFEDQGIEAWRKNVVPSYITNNPYIAQCYARVVIGYLRDCYAALDRSQPVYLVELGGGAGRFAFHFLRSFLDLLAQSPFPDLNFCYVLSDMPERNLAFWVEHPAFREWASAGKLDFAVFDAVADPEIRLHHAGRSITPGDIKNPLIFLGNYFFDSLPQDAFHVEQGRVQECLIGLTSKQQEPDPTAAEVLTRLKINFRTQEEDKAGYYNDPDLDAVLEQYRGLENSYVLFPVGGIRMLRGLIQHSGGRMLLLSGDFGLTRAEEWDHNGAPDIRIHGSISMEVNFHALGAFFKNQGGQFFSPRFYSRYLTVCAFVMDERSMPFPELALAYDEAIERSGPNDFFLLKRGMERAYTVLTMDEMLSFLRISGWDAHLFLDSFADLLEILPSADTRAREELLRAVGLVWENYFHLGEERDLPFNLGVVLYRLDHAKEALQFFERSLEYYGASPLTLFNIALCLTQLHQYQQAWARVKQALAMENDYEPALKLAEELKKHPANRNAD